MTLRAARLLLRPFEDGDRAPFAAMNADPDVMRHFPAPLSRAESDALIDRIEAKRAADGFCFWAVETEGALVGMCGLSIPGFEAHFMPCVEIGWRFAPRFQRRGLATEAARACLDWGFADLGLGEIVAFTAPGNARSRALMERLGMTRDPKDDFMHPALPEGGELNPTVLYRLSKQDFAR